MSETGIIFDGVSKKYRINPGGLSDALYLLKRRLKLGFRKNDFYREIDPEREIWALKDVSFEVRKGEALGLIGPNGAGKSTLLKILSGITKPTTGSFEMKGRFSALIEIGAGFHDELTGKENIYMNGAILGMSRKEIEGKFDEIVEFSGLGKFINTPLKKYSSGMRVRLGFSIAAHIEPEILLIDEVLAVGDVNFQNKSISKMRSFKEKGISIIFVSHSMPSVLSMCDRALYLEKGMMRKIGPVADVIDAYLRDSDLNMARELHRESSLAGAGTQALKIEKVLTVNNRAEPSESFQYRENITVRVFYDARRRMLPYFYIYIMSRAGIILAANMQIDGDRHYIEGKGYFDCVFESVPLLPGTYQIRGGAFEESCVGRLLPDALWGVFSISTPFEDYGFASSIGLVASRCDIWRVDQYHWCFKENNKL